MNWLLDHEHEVRLAGVVSGALAIVVSVSTGDVELLGLGLLVGLLGVIRL